MDKMVFNSVERTKVMGVLFLTFLVSPFAHGIDLTSVNFNYKYDPDALVNFNYNLSRSDSAYHLLFRVGFSGGSEDNFAIKFYRQKGYRDLSESASNGVALNISTAGDPDRFSGVYDFMADSAYDLAIIEVLHQPSEKAYYYDIPLGDLINFDAPDFDVKSKKGILFDSYLPYPDSIFWDGPPIYVYEYDEDFPPAQPPVSVAPDVSRTLSVNSISLNDDGFKPEMGKFYFLQTDSSSFSGVTVVSTPPLYPRLIKIDDVIQPLVYISTKTEFDDIEYSQDKKKAFDRFWLDITRSPDRAVKTIRYYFRQIAGANRFFTGYKQGWKTDMGMVFIIFGSPDAVRRSATTETWIYDNLGGNENIVFSFNKIRNIFTPNYYDLARTEELKRFWFQRVNQWRKGRI